MIKGVLFDLDGVVTDTVAYHYRAWNKLVKEEFNREITWEFNENLKGVDRIESLNRILNELKIELNEDQIKRLAVKKNEYYKELITEINPKDILPGIKELLELLQSKGIKIALASASKNAPSIIEKLGLENYFKHIADPTNVKSKPSPEIFIKAAELIGIKPCYCIGIEDSEAGITAINECGAVSVGIGDDKLLKMSKHNLFSTNEIVDLISKLV